MKTIHQTKDGRTFDRHADAVAHEDILFEEWLQGNYDGGIRAENATVLHILDALDTNGEDWFEARRDSEAGVFKELVRKFFDKMV